MSRRTSILKALSDKFKTIDGATGFNTNLYGEAHAKLKFWDEVEAFPCIYMSPGTEYREYLPSAFKWGFLAISIKLYVKSTENSAAELELLLEDVEKVIDANNVLVYDADNNYETTELTIQSITTDEGLLAPYGVGEVNVQVRYTIM
jgi:hypothetical protein